MSDNISGVVLEEDSDIGTTKKVSYSESVRMGSENKK